MMKMMDDPLINISGAGMEVTSGHSVLVKSHTFWCLRLLMTLSRPLNAPEATKRMLVVSTGTLSPRSLRELRSGTLTVVPSSNLSMPCIMNKGILFQPVMNK